MDCPWGFRSKAEFCLGESRWERRRPIGKLQNETLPGNGSEAFRNKARDRPRRNGHGYRNHNLSHMVRCHAQRAVVIDLA